MSARHALLGLLLDRPAYPYDLGNRLEEQLGPTWALNPGQLSRAIARMRKEGLIIRVPAEDRRGRKVVAITEKGIAEVERWWSEESQSGAPLFRRPLLVKLTLAGPEHLRATLRQIEAYELDCAERLKDIARRREAVPEGPQLRADHVLLRLGLRGDMFQLEGELGWARHAHQVVSWLLNRETIWPTRDRPAAESTDDRRHARERLFERMAAKHLEPVPETTAEGERDSSS